jgi:WD40 repeat protein
MNSAADKCKNVRLVTLAGAAVLSVFLLCSIPFLFHYWWKGTVEDTTKGNGRNLDRTSTSVQAIGVFSNNEYIVAGSMNGNVALFNYGTKTMVWTQTVSTNHVTAIAISPNEQLIACSTYDANVIVIDPKDGRILHRLEIPKEHPLVERVCFISNSKIGACTWDGMFAVWDIETQRRVSESDEGYADTFVMDHAHDRLIYAAPSGLIYVSESGNFKDFYLLEAHNGKIWALAVSRSGNYLVSGGADTTLKVWDINERRLIYEFNDHSLPVLSVAISRNSNILASASSDKTAKVWDLTKGVILREFLHEEQVVSVGLSSDGTIIATGTKNDLVNLWNTKTGARVGSFHVR